MKIDLEALLDKLFETEERARTTIVVATVVLGMISGFAIMALVLGR